MNGVIKLRVGLKGQLNHVRRLIKATSPGALGTWVGDYWKNTQRQVFIMNAGIKQFKNQREGNQA